MGCGVIREPEYNWIVFVPPEPYPDDPSEDYLRCHLARPTQRYGISYAFRDIFC